jgi:hypothetical protein
MNCQIRNQTSKTILEELRNYIIKMQIKNIHFFSVEKEENKTNPRVEIWKSNPRKMIFLLKTNFTNFGPFISRGSKFYP